MRRQQPDEAAAEFCIAGTGVSGVCGAIGGAGAGLGVSIWAAVEFLQPALAQSMDQDTATAVTVLIMIFGGAEVAASAGACVGGVTGLCFGGVASCLGVAGLFSNSQPERQADGAAGPAVDFPSRHGFHQV